MIWKILYYNDCVYYDIYIDFQQLNYVDDFMNGQLQYYKEGYIFLTIFRGVEEHLRLRRTSRSKYQYPNHG